MIAIENRLRNGEVLLGDGAMGTLLQERGLPPGECPELWCIERPGVVEDIHRQYLAAGSDMVECNSFGASASKLKRYGLETRVAEINRAAAALARRAAGTRACVLGSVGPTGEFLQPYGEQTEQALHDVFHAQIAALVEGGADAVIIETMTAIEEAVVAIRAARRFDGLSVLAGFTFDRQASGTYASMMGVSPERFAREALHAGAHVIGANCGAGPDQMVEVVRLLRAAAPHAPILAMPNAGMPVLEDGQTVFKLTPREMADAVPALVDAGAGLIGGCCGTRPEHIAAIRDALAGRR